MYSLIIKFKYDDTYIINNDVADHATGRHIG